MICRYCGGVIKLIPAKAVYGESARRLGMEGEYLCHCQNCNARVGCHKGTTRPLGNVANEVLRLKRMEAHRLEASIHHAGRAGGGPDSVYHRGMQPVRRFYAHGCGHCR